MKKYTGLTCFYCGVGFQPGDKVYLTAVGWVGEVGDVRDTEESYKHYAKWCEDCEKYSEENQEYPKR